MGVHPVFSTSSLQRPNAGQDLLIRYHAIRDGANIDAFDSTNAIINAILHLQAEITPDYVTICCGDRSWIVLKSVACPLSGFFNGLCDPRSQESQEGKIVLQEVDPVVLDRVLQFMNAGPTTTSRSFPDDIQFYLLALYLDIPALQGYVISRCENHYFVDWKSVEAMLVTVNASDSSAAIKVFRELFSKTQLGNGMRLALMRGFLNSYTSWRYKKNEIIALFQIEEPDIWRVLCGMQRALNTGRG